MSEALPGMLSIQIETTSFCNRRCVFCPNSVIPKSPDMLMEWKTIHRVVAELQRLRYQGRVHLYGNGEPLADPRFPEILQFVRTCLPENYLFISTNGDLAAGDRTLSRLLELGLNEIHVSHYDESNRHLMDRELPGVHHFGLGTLGLEFYNRAGHVKVGSVMDHRNCWWAYGKAYINFKGDWCLCCSDWQGEVVWGNVNEQPMDAIWDDARFRRYRETHATGRGKQDLPFCNKCNR